GAPLVTLAVPCRRDEPALDRTLDAAWASWRRTARPALEILVCLNGRGGEGPRDACATLARRTGAGFAEMDVDHATSRLPARGTEALSVAVLSTAREGKAIAWNVLRARARGGMVVFTDADVGFTPDALGLLLDALDAQPDAVVASAKTTCVM